MKRAIFLDIDGTILDCIRGITDITPKVKTVIRMLQKQGDYVFIATGRPYAFLSDAILDFGFDGFILANGAQVIINNKVIYENPLDKEYVKEITTDLENINVQYVLEGKTYAYMKEEFKDFYAFYDKIGVSRKNIKASYDIDDIDIFKIEMLCQNEHDSKLCVDLIKRNPDYDYFASISKNAFELYLKENTKATGILKAIEYLNILIENTYAFGDGKNDIEMLSTVGCGIAMGNACNEVKSYANKVTDTVNNDGVAVGIENYILC